MKLKQFFEQSKMPRKEFIEKADISESMLSYLISGERHASPKVAERIEQITNGMVTRLEILYPD